jgi:hypothetical protein
LAKKRAKPGGALLHQLERKHEKNEAARSGHESPQDTSFARDRRSNYK